MSFYAIIQENWILEGLRMFKKISLLLLIAATMFVACASAETIGTYEPGDIFDVEFAVTANPNNAVFAEVELQYNENALKYLEGDFSQKGVATMLNINGLRVGHTLTARFQILPDSEAGLQNISLTVNAAYNYADQRENLVTGISFSESAVNISMEASMGLTAEEKNRIGLQYYYGKEREQNYSKAAYYFRLAADQRDAYGQCNLGYMYDMGYGVEQNYEKAVYYYELAANQGHASGQRNLGYMYDMGYGVEQNDEKAVYYYELAANQGDALAQNNLGYMYENGYGVEQNYEKAVYYYELAANQGNAVAQKNLGYMYENGDGVEQNYEKAVYYFELAANQGYDLGQSWLGYMFEKGYGVQKDILKAIEYYQLAADQGEEYAIKALERLKIN